MLNEDSSYRFIGFDASMQSMLTVYQIPVFVKTYTVISQYKLIFLYNPCKIIDSGLYQCPVVSADPKL